MTPKHPPWWAAWVCLLAGHVWKTSWRRKADYAALVAQPDSALSYRDRQSGNPWCEFSAGWHFKCRRCRYRTRGDRWEPWYRDYWIALTTVLSSWKIILECYGWWPGDHWSVALPWYRRLVAVPLGLWWGLGHALLHLAWSRNWPFGPGLWVLETTDEVLYRLEGSP